MEDSTIGFWHYRRATQDGCTLRWERPVLDEEVGEWFADVTLGNLGACAYGKTPQSAHAQAFFSLWISMAHNNS